jgi:hypothetical protein
MDAKLVCQTVGVALSWFDKLLDANFLVLPKLDGCQVDLPNSLLFFKLTRPIHIYLYNFPSKYQNIPCRI